MHDMAIFSFSTMYRVTDVNYRFLQFYIYSCDGYRLLTTSAIKKDTRHKIINNTYMIKKQSVRNRVVLNMIDKES